MNGRFKVEAMKSKATVIGMLLSCLVTAFLGQTDVGGRGGQHLPLLNGRIRVGPFFPQTANGITWVVDDRLAYHLVAGFVENGQLLAEYKHLAAPWRPLAAATDSSYYAMEWKLKTATVRLRWTAQADGQVLGILETDREIQAALLTVPAWTSFPTMTYRLTQEGLAGAAEAGRTDWSVRVLNTATRKGAAMDADSLSAVLLNGSDPAKTAGPCAGLLFAISATAPLKFVAGMGPAAGAVDVDAKLAEAQRRYAAGEGPSREAQCLEAIRVEMNLTRLYSPHLKTLAHTVSRDWCPPGLIRLFCWDSFFNGILASTVDPDTARQTIRAILTAATPEGFVPNVADDRSQGQPSDRSQLPVGAMAVWRMHQRQPNRAFLEEVYPKLVKWHDWWFAPNPATGRPYRDGNGNGLLEWGSATGGFQNMKWESLDDSPMFDDMVPDQSSKTMRLDAVDLNSLWAMDAENLGRMAEALGKPEEARRFRHEVETMNRRMNELLWDEEAGFYANRYWEPRMETFRAAPVPVPAEALRTPSGAPGLEVEYFSDRNFEQAAQKEVVLRLDYDWTAAPQIKAGEKQDGFSIRWAGKLVVPKTGTYVLSFLNNNDNSYERLWLDGQLLIDDFKRNPEFPAQHTPPWKGTAHRTYDLKIEYSDKVRTRGKLALVWWPLDPATPKRVFSGRYGPWSFFPMMSGAPDAARAKRLLANLKDEKQFWGEYVIPTISRQDPAFPDQFYWRGNIWAPTNYLLWLGLQRYGDAELLDAYSAKCGELFLRNWNANRTCNENYRAHGVGADDPHYTWGALLALIQIERQESRLGRTR